jgi:hypothetical protein
VIKSKLLIEDNSAVKYLFSMAYGLSVESYFRICGKSPYVAIIYSDVCLEKIQTSSILLLIKDRMDRVAHEGDKRKCIIKIFCISCNFISCIIKSMSRQSNSNKITAGK